MSSLGVISLTPVRLCLGVYVTPTPTGDLKWLQRRHPLFKPSQPFSSNKDNQLNTNTLAHKSLSQALCLTLLWTEHKEQLLCFVMHYTE